MSTPTIFVCGATGIQGGYVAKQLLGKSAKIHSMTRDISTPNAKAAEALGIKLWAGDFDNKDVITAAMEGCTAAFLNFMPDFTDTTSDRRWANNLLTAAKAAGVKHVIYSSGLMANTADTNPDFAAENLMSGFMLSKNGIEKDVMGAGFQYWTIVRAGNFYTNYINPHVFMYQGLLDKGVTQTAISKETQIPCIDPITIGNFVTAAFYDPTKFHAQELEIADELKTFEEILAGISAVTGKELKLEYLDDETIAAQKDSNPFIAGQLISRKMDQFIDMDKVKTWGVPPSSLDAFLKREKARVDETYHVSA